MTNEKSPHAEYQKRTIAKLVLDYLKKRGKLGASLAFFIIGSVVLFVIGAKVMSVFFLFYFLSIIIRLPDTYQDFLILESTSTFGFILAMIGSVPLAAFFAFTAVWFTRWVSPYGDVEEMAQTISMSVGELVAILAIPLLFKFAYPNLLTLLLSYFVVQYIVYQIVIMVTSPATIVNDLFQTVASLPFLLMQSYLIVYALGLPILRWVGVHGWKLGSLRAALLL